LPPADAAQLADARKLLVTGPELGPNWFALEVPADEQQHEQGDLCGTAAAAEKGRLLDTSNEFNSQEFDGAGRQTIARYKPAAAISAARAVLDRLGHCTNVKQDFDGDIAVVTVTPQKANLATFTLKFASGSVSYGAIAITNTADYISTSMSYAVDEPTAAELAGELDLAAQKKLTAAKLD
jgi:hypothetical protein